MLAARDQENLVHGHQQAAASKPLNQITKTPGNKYPKTPLKIPLQDENAPAGFGGKSVKGKELEGFAIGKNGKTFDKNAFVTPMGPRTRAPLGQKTTNAKAKAFQTPAGPAPEKELEKTQVPKTSARRPKKVTHAETVKLQIHGDESPLQEREVEYAPPKPNDLPYESDEFPRNCLNYDALKPGNLMRGLYDTYYNQVDENGMTKIEREYAEGYKKAARDTDERILKMLEEEWTVGDVPETFQHLNKKQPRAMEPAKKIGSVPQLPSKVPGTIASRKAASALSVAPNSAAVPPKTSKPPTKPVTSFLSRSKPVASLPVNMSTTRHSTAMAASRSTLGYTKGRSASGVLQKREGGMTRSVSNLSQGSDTTITPARFAEKYTGLESDDWKRLKFLGAFDHDDEEIEPGLRGLLPDCLRRNDEEDEDFVMTLGSSS